MRQHVRAATPEMAERAFVEDNGATLRICHCVVSHPPDEPAEQSPTKQHDFASKDPHMCHITPHAGSGAGRRGRARPAIAAGILGSVRTDPRMLLRGFAKFVAVVVVSGLAGAGIGIALSKLSGDDATGDPVLPATAARASTAAAAPAGTTIAKTTTATVAQPPASATTTYRVPRVQVLSAHIGTASATAARTLVTVRVRVTNRGTRALTIKTPALVSGQDTVALGASARGAAGALLRPIAPGSSATGLLGFSVSSAVAQRLTTTPVARLRVANRTITLKLTTG